MMIAGIQKLTLLDYPGKVACTVFLNGCNFRCPYCHNAELLEQNVQPVMTMEELVTFLHKRKGILDGVCITGGEPTIHPELPKLIRTIRDMGYSIKLDTNGFRPEVLRTLLSEELVDYVAMDLKNGPDAYGETVGLKQFDPARIRESIGLLLDSGTKFELRTTLVKPFHSGESLTSMAKWVLEVTGGRGVPRLFVQPFVDRETVPVGGLSAPSPEELEQFTRILSSCAKTVEVRGT